MAAKNYKTKVAIIGGGITGLTVAAELQKAGIDYLVVEAQAEIGGLAKGQQDLGLWLDYGLKSVPAGGEVNQNPLLQLKRKLGLNVNFESWSDGTKTFADKGFADFVGFGENKNTALIEELSYYTQMPRLMVSSGWQTLINELLKIIPEDCRLTKTIITRFEVKDDQVVAATVNGDSTLTAEKFIFTLSPTHLKNMLPTGAVSAKLLQRIARTTPFTAVSLDIATKTKVSDGKNIFVFKDAPKNEDPFFVTGYFMTNIDPLRNTEGTQVSSWLTLVDPEAMVDDENGSKIIKTMKKLIKKAFPQLIEEKSWERLLVVPDAIGHFDQMILEKNLTLPGLSNFWVCGAQTRGAQRNILQALASAQSVAEIIAGAPEPKEVGSHAETDRIGGGTATDTAAAGLPTAVTADAKNDSDAPL